MSSNDPRRYPRTLRLHSGCLVVTIPPTLARRLGWTVGNQIAIRQEGQEIVLSYVHRGTTSPNDEKHRPLPNGKNAREFQARREEQSRLSGNSNH
jgi:antitoxin component of MazEF toxin-antitoxin module